MRMVTSVRLQDPSVVIELALSVPGGRVAVHDLREACACPQELGRIGLVLAMAGDGHCRGLTSFLNALEYIDVSTDSLTTRALL